MKRSCPDHGDTCLTDATRECTYKLAREHWAKHGRGFTLAEIAKAMGMPLDEVEAIVARHEPS